MADCFEKYIYVYLQVFLYGSNRDKFILEDPDLTLNGSEVIEVS
jgi:hypothetical protein